MPTTYYAISSGTNKWIKTIDKVNHTFTETSFANQVLEYTVQATAEADCASLADWTGVDRFHVVPTPKGH